MASMEALEKRVAAIEKLLAKRRLSQKKIPNPTRPVAINKKAAAEIAAAEKAAAAKK